MRAAKTVFIVGAGASDEAGLPFGRGFLEIISQKLNYRFKGPSMDFDSGDADILDVIQQFAPDRASLNKYLDAGKRIREGLLFSRSIDAFIDVHRNDETIRQLGKLAIAKTILEQEQRSHIYIAPQDTTFRDMKKLNDSWFVSFMRGLNEGIQREQIDRIFDGVSFVVFNYDRCVEHILYNALQKHHGIDAAQAQSVMKRVKILHPYGKIANLPWQEVGGIPFGFSPNRPNLMLMMKQIKTYTEQVEDSGTLEAVKREVSEAETLVFLGFSYLELNMNVLDPGEGCSAKCVLGTASGISASDVEEIKGRVRNLIGHNLFASRLLGPQVDTSEKLYIRSDLKCAALLEEYSRTLFVAQKRRDA